MQFCLDNRSSMGEEKLHFVHKEGLVFAGAIFMSNRATKLECLQRKLFGLPQSKAKFLEQVKAGMILFLFEHEERKLYGVFEATSDGALNIIPDAFRSSGQSYPAQICCKRILMCRPLCEDEFHSAIQENYYSSNKFHFGLSNDQVTNLIHLFYSKKINLNQHEKPVLPNIINKSIENSAAEKARLTEVGSYVKCESDKYSREGKQEVKRKYSLPQSSLDLPMHSIVTDTGRGSNQNLHALLPPPSCSQHLYSEPVTSSLVPDDRVAFYHISTGKQNSTTEEMDCNKPLPRESNQCTTKFDNVAVPYLMGPHHYSSPDVAPCVLSCSDMIPRQIKIQEPRVFESLRVVNDDCHQTAVLQHASVFAAQPDQLFEFPDYIPLPEDLQQDFVEENQNSVVGNFGCVSTAAFRSCIPSTCKKISEGLYTDDDEMNIYGRLVSDDYLAVGRASVFSRLSRGQNVYKHETPESSLPLDQLVNILDSRRKRWSTTSKQSGKWCSDDQHARTDSMGLTDQSSGRKDKFVVQPVEPSKDDQYERFNDTKNVGFDTSLEYYDQSSVVSEKESFELPFYNFRRRNMNQKFEAQDDSNTCNKRRRILRPSLFGEEQNTKGITEVKPTSQMKDETEVKTLATTTSKIENENKAVCLKSELEGEPVSTFICPETELKVPAQMISEHETENKDPGFQICPKSQMEGESISSFICSDIEVKMPSQEISEGEIESKAPGFQTGQKSELEGEAVSSFFCTETEVKMPTQAISEHTTESKVPGFPIRQNSEMEGKSISSFICPENEVNMPTQAISDHETESMTPGFQTHQKSELEWESIVETEVKMPTQAISEHETESMVPGFQIRQYSEMESKSVPSFICTETKVKMPTEAISEHETESRAPGFQTLQKSEMEVESVSSFFCPETEAKTPIQMISETRRKSKMEGESVEANHATFSLESEGYIPLG